MPIYLKLGEIPRKRHTTFRKEDGSLYAEELFGTTGFSGPSSLIYHLNPPTRIIRYDEPYSVAPEIAVEKNLKPLSFKGYDIKPEDDYLKSRKTLFVNNDMHIGLAAPKGFSKDYFF
jgi:homogentisate 1,2-dioxygenase